MRRLAAIFCILCVSIWSCMAYKNPLVRIGGRIGAEKATGRISSSRAMAGMPYVPYYPDKAKKDYMWLDIYNALGRTRTLFVGRFLDEEAANQLIASLIWLESQSNKDYMWLDIYNA